MAWLDKPLSECKCPALCNEDVLHGVVKCPHVTMSQVFLEKNCLEKFGKCMRFLQCIGPNARYKGNLNSLNSDRQMVVKELPSLVLSLGLLSKYKGLTFSCIYIRLRPKS